MSNWQVSLQFSIGSFSRIFPDTLSWLLFHGYIASHDGNCRWQHNSCTGAGVVGLWLAVSNALFYILRGVLQSHVTPSSTSKPALLKTSHGANYDYWTAGGARPEMSRPSKRQFPECQQTAVRLDRQHSWCSSIQSGVWFAEYVNCFQIASSWISFINAGVW